jgi:sugar/nucleoside kinase (ribokinase family)
MEAFDWEVEGLAADAAFRKWVMAPDAASDAHWESYLLAHPGHQPVLERARRLVQAHGGPHYLPSESSIERMWAVIQRAIQ